MFKKKNYRSFNVRLDYLDKAMYMKFERLEFLSTYLTIYNLNSIFKRKQTIKRMIDYKDILTMEYVSELKEELKNKNFIGRTIVGGLLLGGTGAVIGGLSSVAPKCSSKRYYFVVITLKNGEVIKMQDCQGATIDYGFFNRMYKSYADYKERMDNVNDEVEYLLHKEIQKINSVK